MIYAITLGLVTCAAVMYSNALAAQRAKRVNNKQIVDTIHDAFEPCSSTLVEVLLVLPVLVTLITAGRTNILWVITTYCLLMLLRCILVQVTIFPSIDPQCDRPFICLGNCNDYMFSGHTILLTLTCLTLWKVGVLPKSLALSYILLLMVLISAARNHYFIDTIIAFVFAGIAFFIAHPQLHGNITDCMKAP